MWSLFLTLLPSLVPHKPRNRWGVVPAPFSRVSMEINENQNASTINTVKAPAALQQFTHFTGTTIKFVSIWINKIVPLNMNFNAAPILITLVARSSTKLIINNFSKYIQKMWSIVTRVSINTASSQHRSDKKNKIIFEKVKRLAGTGVEFKNHKTVYKYKNMITVGLAL